MIEKILVALIQKNLVQKFEKWMYNTANEQQIHGSISTFQFFGLIFFGSKQPRFFNH
jgi:hypothetical protein